MVGILGLIVSIFLGSKIYYNVSKITENTVASSAVLKNLQNTKPEDLNFVGDGRINVLIIGTTDFEVDEGALTDTLIIGSFDFINNQHGMFSVPRDTWVNIPTVGDLKINNAYSIGEQSDVPGAGIDLLKDTIKNNFNIPIHYSARLNVAGVQKLVDDVGGISIDVPETIIDPSFNASELGYAPPFILNSGLQTLDGKTASFYMRSRKTSDRGDFDRNDRQREVITKLAEKILQQNYYNPSKALSVLSSFGDSLRVDIPLTDIKNLYDVSKNIDIGSLASLGLNTDTDNYLADKNINGAAALVPKTGDYNDITKFFFSKFPDPFLLKEKPVLSILNGSGLPGLASQAARELESLGYIIESVDNFDDITEESAVVVNSENDLPYSENYLEKTFNSQSSDGDEYRYSNDYPQSDFVIILGKNYQDNLQTLL